MIDRRLTAGTFVALALLLAGGPVAAAEIATVAPAAAPDEAQKSALARTVADFSEAFRTGQAAPLVDAIPPRFLQETAKQTGVSPDVLRATAIEEASRGMSDLKDVSFTLDLAAARYLKLPDGTPYALIPTETTIVRDGRTYLANSDTLALFEASRWYLLRVGDAKQIERFLLVYPEFSSVSFKPATIKATL